MEFVSPLMRFPIAASARMDTRGPYATSKGNCTTHAKICSVSMVSARSQTQVKPTVNATGDSMATSVTKVRQVSMPFLYFPMSHC